MLENLEDENAEIFRGVTLEISQENVKSTKENVENSQVENQSKIWSKIDPIISLPKKITSNIWSSATPNSSNTCTQVLPILKTESPSDYFTFRCGVLDNAVRECTEILVDGLQDGQVIGAFLVTEISLWDNEKERIMIVTPNYLYSIKYDFIALKHLEYRKISIKSIDSIFCGDLIYPTASLVPKLQGIANGLSDILKGKFLHRGATLDELLNSSNRNTTGVRIMWNKGETLPFTQKWNPFSNDIPFFTVTAHPLCMHSDALDEKIRFKLDFEEFKRTLIETVQRYNESCIVNHKEIVLQNYMGLGSVIHNRNALGFFKVRGKFSF